MIKRRTILNIADNSGIKKITMLLWVKFFKIFVIQETKDNYRPFLFKMVGFASRIASTKKSVKFRFRCPGGFQLARRTNMLDRITNVTITPFLEPIIISSRLKPIQP